MTLIGMLLTLQSNQTDKNESYVEVHSIGKSGWFTGLISLLFLSITVLCALFFLPTIRNMLYTAGISSVNGVKWVFHIISKFVAWIFNLFPSSNKGGEMPFSEREGPMMQGEEKQLALNIPYDWIIGIIIVIVSIVSLWMVATFLKQWQRPEAKKPNRQLALRDSFFSTIKNKIVGSLRNIRQYWMKKFPHFYKQPIYWYYYKLQKWGEKNGFTITSTETSKEYIEKIIDYLRRQLPHEDSAPLISQLHELSEDYQHIYYGKDPSASNKSYKRLLDELKTWSGKLTLK